MKTLTEKFEESLRKRDERWLEEVESRESEIERLKALLTRAADALESIESCKHWQWSIDLAAELRKAAQ